LADPFVAPHQLILECVDDIWRVTVLEKINAVLLNGVPIRDDWAPVKTGDKLTVGRTDLALYAEDHVLEPTRKLLLSSWITPGRIGALLAFGVLGAVCAMDVIVEFLQSSVDLKWKDYAYGSVFAATLIVIWAGVWAIAGRVLRHQPHFFVHLLATALVSGVSTFLVPLAGYLDFLTSNPALTEISYYLLGFGIFAVLLKLNLFFATNIRRTSVTAVVISAMLAGLIFVANRYGKDDFESEPEYAQTVKPPFAHLTRDRSPEEFLEAAAQEFDKL
jgi:hypothetical protein